MVVNHKRLGLSLLLTLSMLLVFALLLSGFAQANTQSERANASVLGVSDAVQSIVSADLDDEAPDGDRDGTLAELAQMELPEEYRSSVSNDTTIVSLDDTATYIVVLTDAPLARYSGGVAGLAPTSRAATGSDKFDARSADSVRYLSYLDARRAAVVDLAGATLGRSLDVSYQYGATIVGFAAEMTGHEALALEQLDNVRYVEKERVSYPQTDSGPVWAGAAEVWGGDWAGLNYKVSMDGASQVTPVTTNVSGSGTFTYNFYTNLLEYEITVTNPDSVELTAMHIHTGTAGNTGGVVYNFAIATTTSDVSVSGSTTLADEYEVALVNDGLYVNVHSTANAAGEVRGQIDLSGSLGEGVVVGIIDTGIDPWNPSFAAVGGDGYVHTNPNGSGTYLGVCDPANSGGDGVVAYDATFPCNDKLIGVWGYTASDASPRDTDGHGSHTAGTSAGNIVFDSVIDAPTDVYTSDISGVAPHANIIAYDGCEDAGGCPGAALSAAREQALLDNVDVINYSIGSSSPTGDFWSDSEAEQWLSLRAAGVFVATSNGNAGNGDATTGSPADTPWLTSVGANSHDRSFFVTVILTDTTNQTVTVSGQAMAAGYGPVEIIFSDTYSDTDDARLCAPDAFAPGTFSGEIVICERGEYGRVAKGQSVLDGGAGGYILAQPDEATGGPGSVAADTHVLPAAHIDYDNYQILRQFLLTDAVGTVEAELSGASLDIDDSHGDIMASFSSRGPNGTDADLIVPKVTAPGRAIWAAYAQGDGGDGDYTFNAIQGTSMSSPHVAGAGALLVAMQPDWTPSEIESALMLTARDNVLDDDGVSVATPFAQGSGHIAIGHAAMSPLVMNVTEAEYLAADPSDDDGFDVRDLNIASMGEDNCVESCTWVRTVENVSGETLDWSLSLDLPISVTGSVEPTSFSLDAGDKQVITVELNVSSAALDEAWLFATLDIDEDSGDYPDAHMPIAVYPSAGNVPDTLDIVTQTTTGTIIMDDLLSVEITNMQLSVIGLDKADRHEFTLVEDNDTSADFPDIFFDDLATTHFVSFTVPVGSFSAIADIVETQSPDLDMLLFLDVDGDGPELEDVGDPDSNDDACQSATGGSNESCEILSPTAGTYYVAVINFSQVTPGGDFVDLATAVVPEGGADAGNLVVSGPASNPAVTPYSLTVTYDDSSMTAIDKLYGYFTVGSDTGSPDDVGTVRVSLEYLGIPDIDLDPMVFTSTQAQETRITKTVTLSTANGVLDWNVTTPSGDEAVQDGSFEQGYGDNPYWRGTANIADGILPICSAATCGFNVASDGDWFVWFGGAAGIEASVEQDITIPEGDVANLTFNMLMGTGDATVATATLDIYLDGTLLQTFTEADLDDYGTYPAVSIDVSSYADGGDYLLRFEYANSAAVNYNTFIDEVSIVSVPAESLTCNVVSNISWLSISPSSGLLSPGHQELVLEYDAAGLGEGVFTDTLCINSNDPDEGVLNIPVTLTVAGDPPEISVDKTSASAAIVGSGEVTETFTFTNTGGGPLDWFISEVDNTFPSRALSGDVYVTEGFEDSVPPTGWTVVDGDPTEITWLQSSVSPYEGSFSAAVFYPGNTNPVDTWLLSPSFSTGENEGIVSFQARGSAFWCVIEDNCDLDIWIVVGETAGDSDDIYLGAADDEWVANHVWVYHSYLIPENSDDIRIGFHVTAADGDTIRLDAVNIAEKTSICDAPADISWLSASPTSGRIEVGDSDFTEITMDSSGLSNGTYTGTLCINANDPLNAPLEIPVTLDVAKPDPELTTDETTKYGRAGDVFSYTVDLTNIGDITDTFDISITNTGWDMDVDALSTVNLAPGISTTMDITVTIPATATYPLEDEVTIIATSQAYTSEVDTMVLTTAMGAAVPELEASMASQEVRLLTSLVTYTVDLTNNGPFTGVFDIALSGNSWTASSSITMADLDVDGETSFDVVVTVPMTATYSDSDSVTVTATWQEDNTVSDSIDLNTEVSTDQAVPELEASVTTQQIDLNTAYVTYTVGLTNTGGLSGVFDIAVSGNSWTSMASISTADLDVDAGTSFDVVVTVPMSPTYGDSDSVTVTATWQDDNTVSDSIVLNTVVGEYLNYLPILNKE